MKTNKILHIAPTPFFSDRGCHIRIEGIVRCLNNLDYENLVCTYHHGRDIEGINTKRIGTIKRYTKTSAGPSIWKLWADEKLLWLCFNEYRKGKPNVLHAHLHEGLLIALIIKTLFFWRKTPLIADMQGSLVGELETYGFFNKAAFLKLPFKWLEASLLFFSTKVICSSEHSLNKFVKEFPKSAHKISLAQDGADQASPITKQEIRQLKREYDLPLDKTIVVYSGALLESKGLSELKQIIKQSLAQSDDIHYLVVGYPVDDIQEFLNKQNISNRVTLTGRVDFSELNNYLAIADIAIDPKNSDAGEGSGKMLNYLANGLAVMAFDSVNNKVFLENEVALAKDSDEMVKKLIALKDDKPLLDTIKRENIARFSSKYSWQVTEKQIISVYKDLKISHCY